MADRYSKRILTHMADSRYEPRQLRELARELRIADAERDDFEQAVQELIGSGDVVLGTAETVILPPPGRQMIGTFRKVRGGFGFLQPESPVEHGDLFVPESNTMGAMTGDLVKARVIHQPHRAGGGRSPYIGRIVDILQRADRHYVGNLTKKGSQWLVIVDGKLLRDPVVIRDPHAKNARQGNKVVFELIDYPDGDKLAEGVITEVLGEQGEPDVETLAVMRAYGLVEPFHVEVMDEARAAARSFDDDRVPSDRQDLTGVFTLTIDPPDARDFDDAITIEKLNPPDGDAAWELGVHIADVSHFVRQGQAMDEQAYHRGNSAYLPRKVIPMLPEVLSNGVCSLQEGVNRFCKSAFIRLDAEGKPVTSRFASSVIRSNKRLTYIEAQALIDGDLRTARKHAKGEAKYPSELIGKLKLMDELAKIIRQRRFKQGMITLDLPEVELVFDDAGRVVDAKPEDASFTHKIIEMFMVEANEASARLFDTLNVPVIRRIHPDPPAHDMQELRQFASVAGFNIPLRPTRAELQGLLDAVRGKPAQHAVHLAVLQTLSRAEYAPMTIGHFALASEHYTHFTSPIRRYADLTIHRAIQAYLDHAGEGGARGGRARKKLTSDLLGDERCPDQVELAEIGRHCSQTERNAEAAEHDLRNYLILELLANHLGDDYEGTITGVTGAGVFVQLDRYLVDGFIRISDLPGAVSDQWRLNRQTGALVAQRSGRGITIGDRFTVRVAKVAPEQRQLDLVIIEDPHTAPKRRQPKGARKAHGATMKIKQLKKSGQPRKDRGPKRKRGK